MQNLNDLYDKNLAYEIYYIEGVQYNFMVNDIIKLLEINDLELFKKYRDYLDLYRISFSYIDSFEDSISKFKSIIKEEKLKDVLVKIFIKHENLFSNGDGFKKLELIPDEYKNRKFEFK